MHVLSRRLFLLAFLAGLALSAILITPAAATNQLGGAAASGLEPGVPLLPFVGTAEIGCTRGSGGPVCGGHHSYDAIDFLMPNGTPLVSPVDGVIVGVDSSCSNVPFTCSGYGNFLHISALDGSASYVLSHLSEVVVEEGLVAAGQLVGYSGESGRASTPHLHFEEHSSTHKELSGERRAPSAYLGCVAPLGTEVFPAAAGYDSWYNVPAHAGVLIVNDCVGDASWLGSDRSTLEGLAGIRRNEAVDLSFDASLLQDDLD